MAKPKNFKEAFAQFPPESQSYLKQLRAIVQKAAPKATETIAWDMPTFSLEGFVVHFAGYKHHIGLYPGSDAIAHFKKDIEKYKWAKGSVQLPLDEKLPVALITRIVKFCVKRNLADAKAKAQAKKAKQKK